MAHSLILMDASTTALQPAVTMATIQMHTQSMMIVSIGHPTIFIFIIWTEKRKERNTLKEPTRTRRPFQPLLYQLHHIRSYHFVLFLKIKKRVLTLGERKRNTFRSERCIHRRPTRCSLSFSFFFFFLFESWRIRFRALWGMFQSIFSLFFIFFPVLFFFSCCVSFVVKALFIPALNYSKLQSWVRARMMAVIITLTLLERKWKKKKHSARETQVGQTIGALRVDHINKKKLFILIFAELKRKKRETFDTVSIVVDLELSQLLFVCCCCCGCVIIMRTPRYLIQKKFSSKQLPGFFVLF